MKIGIIGSGNMGGSLARLWAEKGHNILLTSTSPEQTAEVAKSIGHNVVTGSTADAAAYGDVVVFAFPYESLKDVISKGGSFKNKIVIDLINPLTPDVKGLLLGFETSASEEAAKLIPEAKIVKALILYPLRFLNRAILNLKELLPMFITAVMMKKQNPL